MKKTTLIQAVEKFATLTHVLSDDELELEWSWQAYSEGVRFSFFRTYEDLRELASRLIAQRTMQDKPFTTAQYALAQYHLAYCDLQAVLIGFDNDLIDISPADGEWSSRVILGHIIAAERQFFARIWHAVMRLRNGHNDPIQMTQEEVVEFLGENDDFENLMDHQALPGIKTFYDSLHERVLHELSSIQDSELQAMSLWWEEMPIPIEFRLHRLDSHLRQHTIHLEKTLHALKGAPTEAKRLLRFVYAAQADVEGILIGAWDLGEDQQFETAQRIYQRSEDLIRVLRE